MILVTGSAGTVGSEVVKALSARGAPFRVGYRTRGPDAPGVEAVPIDFDRPETTSTPATSPRWRPGCSANQGTKEWRTI
jgi:nucleoside-diphosphate-sugar epimerase